MQDPIRREVVNALNKRHINKGNEQFRIRHKLKKDGSICTPISKDAAMVITTLRRGVKYYCHRCNEYGWINYDDSPQSVIKQIEHRTHENEQILYDRHCTRGNNITLPNDIIKMTYEDYMSPPPDSPIPTNGYLWFKKYGLLKKNIFNKLNVGWSPIFNRVIIPVHSYYSFNSIYPSKLVGWIGRCVSNPVPEHVSKYTSFMDKSQRQYYIRTNIKSKIIIIVEDALSAIKVNEATTYITLALLNAAVPDTLFDRIKDFKVGVWLDYNMKDRSFRAVNRMRNFGIDAFQIVTQKDPKEFEPVAVRRILWQNQTNNG